MPLYNIRSDGQCWRPQLNTFSSNGAAWFHRYQSSNVYAIFSTSCAIQTPQTKQIKMASEITFLGDYMCRTGYEKSPFLSKADVSKKYRTIERGITREMLLTKSQFSSLPCLDPQEIQSLRETVSGGSRRGARGARHPPYI